MISGRKVGTTVFLWLLVGSPLLQAKERVVNHEQLAEALSVNDLPSGYVTLEHCEVMKRIGSTRYEKWSFSVTFKEHYGINNRKGEIKASSATDLMLEDKQQGNPLPRRLYNNFTSKSGLETFEYGVAVTDMNGKVLLKRNYSCPWSKAVFLWRD
ncbi:hypothetical protein [Endozoicomonas arenosclerae]|uniref:hypothetical protein n=1 Tax=Endozoicomonas arenosclerae TaxID=1633495 RepID=UPI00078296CC|nr:hypothetical protein [Endozoicomonas arenosclerae]